MENCRFTLQLFKKRLRLFSHHFWKPTHSPRNSRRDVWRIRIPSRRTKPPVVMGQSFVLSAIKTESSLESDDPAYRNFPTCEERIEAVHHNRNWVMDAEFLSVLENGQYYMTKDTGDLTQFNTVACREHTLPKNQHHNRKDGSKETQKLDPNRKLQPVTCTVNMDLRSEVCLWTETVLTPGSQFLIGQTSLWWTWTTTMQKFLKNTSKNMRYNWMRNILQADQSKNKTTKKRTLALHQESSPWKELDWHRTWETFSPRERGFEGSGSSSSSFTTSASRKRRSGSLLENERTSSEWRSMENMFDSRTRSKKEIPALHWWFRSNCLFPSSSKTFRTQPYWSFIADV